MGELREEVSGLHHRVAGLVHEQVGVDLTSFFVGVVGDPAGVGEQVSQGDCLGDGRSRQVDVGVDRGVQVEAAGTDLLEHGHAGEQLGDRRRVEAGVDGVGDLPARSGVPVGLTEDDGAGVTDDHHTGEL